MNIPALLSLVLFFIRILVGAMFILAGFLKIKAGSHWFLARVLAYDLVRGRVARTLARVLPWVEMVCGLFLIAGFLLPLTVSVSFALLLVFTTAVVTAFLRDRKVDCGCFGHRPSAKASQARWRIAYRNLILMAFLLILQQFSMVQSETDAWLEIIWLLSLFLTVAAHRLTKNRIDKAEGQINQPELLVQNR